MADSLTGMQIFSLVAFSFILLLGSIGNLLVIYVYGFTTRKRFVKFERLMLMLGIFDFIASVTNPAHYIYRIAYKGVWHLGGFGCKVIPALGPIFTGISLGIILIMAVDRDRAVCTPFKTQFRLNTIYKAVAITIFASTAVTIPYMYYMELYDSSNSGESVCMINADLSYDIIIVTLFTLNDIIFVVIFVTTTVRVFAKLKSKSTAENGKHMRETRARETNRILKLILAMGIMFVVCVFPRDLLIISFSFGRLFPPIAIPYHRVVDVNNVLKVLHTSNSCVNVFLYSLLNGNFRKEVLRILMKSKRFRQSFHRSRARTESSFIEQDTISNDRNKERQRILDTANNN